MFPVREGELTKIAKFRVSGEFEFKTVSYLVFCNIIQEIYSLRMLLNSFLWRTPSSENSVIYRWHSFFFHPITDNSDLTMIVLGNMDAITP